jgi:SIR2-like domain
LQDAFSAHRPFLLKLYGTLEKPSTVIFSPAEYKALISSHVPFTRLMEGLFFSRTLLFIGCSLDGITDFLDSFPFRAENPHRHYAFVGVSGTAWQAKAEALARRYNVEVIPFDIVEGYGAVDVFLQELAARTEEERSKQPPRSPRWSKAVSGG